MAATRATPVLIKKKTPLVHAITSSVSLDFTANLLLAAGAAPVLAHEPLELHEVVPKADAVYINTGMLSNQSAAVLHYAASLCHSKHETPPLLVLDPVGAGLSSFRTYTAASLVSQHSVDIIRGNASEIKSLAAATSAAFSDVAVESPHGVESVNCSNDALHAAQALSHSTGACVAITGATDYVVDAKALKTNDGSTPALRISNGHEMMPCITASGCAVSAFVAASVASFPANEGYNLPDRQLAVANALASVGVAAQFAAADADGPGTLRCKLLDAVYTQTEVQEHAVVEHTFVP